MTRKTEQILRLLEQISKTSEQNIKVVIAKNNKSAQNKISNAEQDKIELEKAEAQLEADRKRADAELKAKMAQEDHVTKQLQNRELSHNINTRLFAGGGIFALVVMWLAFVAFILYHAAFDYLFFLSDTVLTTLLVASSAQVMGLLAIVLKYLFPNDTKTVNNKSK